MHTGSQFTTYNFANKLHADEWRSLLGISRTQSVDKGDYVFRANEISDTLFVLLDGRVKIKRLTKQGRELIQWFCLPGEIFGLAEDHLNRNRGLYAQALTSSKLLCIPKGIFQQYLIENPHISLMIVEQLSSRLRSLGDMLLNMSSENAYTRLVCLLQRLIEFCGRDCAQGIYIDMYLSHQELADMIGVCRQTASSMISRLKQQGIIETNRKGIYIKSPASLDIFNMKTSPCVHSLEI